MDETAGLVNGGDFIFGKQRQVWRDSPALYLHANNKTKLWSAFFDLMRCRYSGGAEWGPLTVHSAEDEEYVLATYSSIYRMRNEWMGLQGHAALIKEAGLGEILTLTRPLLEVAPQLMRVADEMGSSTIVVDALYLSEISMADPTYSWDWFERLVHDFITDVCWRQTKTYSVIILSRHQAYDIGGVCDIIGCGSYRVPKPIRKLPTSRARSGRVRGQAIDVYRDVTVCPYCKLAGDSLTGPDRVAWHYDHIVPISKGGPDSVENLIKCCRTCNLRKSDKSFAAFMMDTQHEPS